MKSPSITCLPVKKIDQYRVIETEDELAIEEPLEIQLEFGDAGTRIIKNISVTMRTPGHDEELAAGFLFTEGIIRTKDAITSIQQLEENRIRVVCADGALVNVMETTRNFFTTSSCGVCGKADLGTIMTRSDFSIRSVTQTIDTGIFYRLQDQLILHQALFNRTGGIHASALFDTAGSLLMIREDVGRHNALDKLIGATFLQAQLPLTSSILFLSGRASFELIQKASMAGIPVVAAVGAPSSLAVATAEKAGITLLGFLRNERFNVYAGAQRLAF